MVKESSFLSLFDLIRQLAMTLTMMTFMGNHVFICLICSSFLSVHLFN